MVHACLTLVLVSLNACTKAQPMGSIDSTAPPGWSTVARQIQVATMSHAGVEEAPYVDPSTSVWASVSQSFHKCSRACLVQEAMSPETRNQMNSNRWQVLPVEKTTSMFDEGKSVHDILGGIDIWRLPLSKVVFFNAGLFKQRDIHGINATGSSEGNDANVETCCRGDYHSGVMVIRV